MDFLLTKKEINLSSLTTTFSKFPLGNLFFGGPFLLILSNLISSNTPIPFL